MDLTEEKPASLSSRDDTVPEPLSPAEPRDVRRSRDRSLGKNGPLVLSVIDDEATLAQIMERTALTDRQARYAVKKLEAAGRVTMKGGQGQRGTTYARTGKVDSPSEQ